MTAAMITAADWRLSATTKPRGVRTRASFDSVQMKAQALAAFLLYGTEIDGVRREVINLRTGQRFHDDAWLESGGREQIEGWRADVTAYMDALDKMRGSDGRRPLRLALVA